MTKAEYIEKIVEKEWVMFTTVNGDDRVSCQEDRDTFNVMRKGQYEAWDEKTVKCFYADICEAEAAGRNISKDKYIYMMRSTDPQGYEHFKQFLPPVTEEKQALVDAIWAKMLEQTQRMRKKYPILALGGRVVKTEDERSGWASIENYQTSEMLTYSVPTLKALLAHIEALEAEGKDLAYIIQENSVLGMGYASMADAENAIARQYGFEVGFGGCSRC